jgi:hypothetical protein
MAIFNGDQMTECRQWRGLRNLNGEVSDSCSHDSIIKYLGNKKEWKLRMTILV